MNDKLLFTPGPLTTSMIVKEAMLHDYGSRDADFISIVRWIREQLLSIAGVSQNEGYESIIIQGSGTYGIEAVVSSAVSAQNKLLVVVNGAYGQRIASIAQVHGIPVVILKFSENQLPDPEALDRILTEKQDVSHVAAVHCETTTGIINPILPIGGICRKHNKIFIVDAMSSFGAVHLNPKECHAHFIISSSNKCLEGVPGFSFVIAEKQQLLRCKGNARTLTLDLAAQWEGLEQNGQFRFTPPTHAILAFEQALRLLIGEGGVNKRATRYRENHNLLAKGMESMGFKPYLNPGTQGYIITSFRYPEGDFHFPTFYSLLSQRGFVIYPGKLTKINCFRIGNIGALQTSHIEQLLMAIGEVKEEMGF